MLELIASLDWTALRRAAAWLYGLFAATVGVAFLLPGAALLLLFCRTQESAWQWAQRYLRVVLRVVGLMPVRSGYPLPGERAILVSNHSSYLDGLLLIAALERPVCLTPKVEMFSWPVIGRILRRLGALPVDRSTSESRHRSLICVERALRAGHRVHLFPEGTFTNARGILPFHSGAFQLSATTRLPVVPVAIIGARHVLPDGRHVPRRSHLEVNVLKPLAPPVDGGSRSIARLRDHVRRALGQTAGEPLLAIADGLGEPRDAVRFF